MEKIKLEEQVKLLVELQGLDSQIFKHKDTLDSMPAKIKELEDNFKEKSVNLKKLEDGVKTLQLKRKEKEGELQTKEESIKKFHSQQSQVKTNKEYKALDGEVERVKADISVLEEEIIKILDETDSENLKVGKEREFLKTEEVGLAAQKKKMEEEVSAVKAELEKLKSQRSGLAAKVDKQILSKYDRLTTSNDGLAIVSVKDETCQGCFRILPPQVTNEIQMKENLVFCEHCARMLYIEE